MPICWLSALRFDWMLSLSEIAAGRTYLPAAHHILRAFEQPLSDVRVLIVGQDPYPTPGHPVGLCFAVDRQVRPLPKSGRLLCSEQALRPDGGFGDRCRA